MCTIVLALGIAIRPSNVEGIIEPIYTLPFEDSYVLTCGWGDYTACGLGPGFHEGTDYDIGVSGVGGDNIVAAASGTAKRCDPDVNAGHYAVMDHGNGHISRYFHLDQPANPPPGGASVPRGGLIGFEGTTGNSTDYHLHFDTRHGASTFTCGKDGTSVDPYAQATWLWTVAYPGPPAYPPPPFSGYDTVGVWTSGAWYLRNALGGPSGPGWPDCAFGYGNGTDTPLMGDWDGNGVDTVGVWRNAQWTSEG